MKRGKGLSKKQQQQQILTDRQQYGDYQKERGWVKGAEGKGVADSDGRELHVGW